MDLYAAIQEKLDTLDKAIALFGDRGKEEAEAERQYRMKKAEKILTLKAEGVPATLCHDIVNGDKEVADLRFKRDVARTMYKSIDHGINVSKLSVRILDEQLKREYGNVK